MTTKVQPQDKTVTVNGLKLHYLDWGAAGNPMMILLHGLRGHAHSWDNFSEAMCGDYHVLAVDQRGRGDSDWAKDGDYTTDAYVSDFAAFCDTLKLDSFILIGHSMGACNSTAYAAQHPERVKKLIVVDSSAVSGPTPGGARITEELIKVPEEFASFEDAYQYQRKENQRPPEDVLRRRVKYQTKDLPNGKIGWRYDVAIREARRNGTVPPSTDLMPSLRKISCPALLVRGGESDNLSPESAQQMLKANSRYSMVTVARAAHMVMEDNPDDFIKEVRGWLESS